MILFHVLSLKIVSYSIFFCFILFYINCVFFIIIFFFFSSSSGENGFFFHFLIIRCTSFHDSRIFHFHLYIFHNITYNKYIVSGSPIATNRNSNLGKSKGQSYFFITFWIAVICRSDRNLKYLRIMDRI